MPHLRPFNDTWVPATPWADGAFEVPPLVFDDWLRLTATTVGVRPRNRHGLPLRPFAAGAYNGDAVAAGIFVDWQTDHVRQFVYDIRNVPRERQPTHRWIAESFGFQHHLHPYRAADAWARRLRDEVARGAAPRRQSHDYRRWSSAALRATAVAAASGYRRFGIEVEFCVSDPYDQYLVEQVRGGIVHGARAAGLTFVERWGRYGRDMHQPGWQGTHDATVSGEIISDIMAGDQASLDEVATMLRLVRDNGGRADRRQGMHVHLDMGDYSTADRTRLVDNVQACEQVLLAFVHPYRRSGDWSAAFTTTRWAEERRHVASGYNGTGNHSRSAWNFGHVAEGGGASRFEVRALGWTLNGTAVRTWIRVWQAFMNATKAGECFAAGVTQAEMVAVLRRHGLSAWAAGKFTDGIARRQQNRRAA